MNRFKEKTTTRLILGFMLFVLVSPLIVLGAVAYLIADATVYGWNLAEEIMEDW